MSRNTLSPRVAPSSLDLESPVFKRASKTIETATLNSALPDAGSTPAQLPAADGAPDAKTQVVRLGESNVAAGNIREVDSLYQSLGSFSAHVSPAARKADSNDDKAAATILEQWQLSPPAAQGEASGDAKSQNGTTAHANAASKPRPVSSRSRGGKTLLLQGEGLEKMGFSKRSLTAVPNSTKWGPGLLRGVSRLVINKRTQSEEGGVEVDKTSPLPTARVGRQQSVVSHTSSRHTTIDEGDEGLDDSQRVSTNGTVRVDDLAMRSRRTSERTSDRTIPEVSGGEQNTGDEILSGMNRVRNAVRRTTDSIISEDEELSGTGRKSRTTMEDDGSRQGFVSRVKSLFTSRSMRRAGQSFALRSATGKSMQDDADAAVASLDGPRDGSGTSGKLMVGHCSSNGSSVRFSMAAGAAVSAVEGQPGDLFAVVRQLQVGMTVNQQASHWKKATRYQSMTVRPLSTLAAFIPKLLIEDIKTNDAKYSLFDNYKVGDEYKTADELLKATKSLKPSMTYFNGAVMIADVTGFTALTEILSKRGNSGVELLTTCMNSFFTKVISLIFAFDGDVVKFAGDSMIVAFYPMEREKLEADGGMHAACLRALQCAHQLAHKLGKMRMRADGEVEPVEEHLDEEEEHEDKPETSALSDTVVRQSSNTTPLRSASDNLIERLGSGSRRNRSASMPETPLQTVQSDEIPGRLSSTTGSFTRKEGLLERLGKRMAFKTAARGAQAVSAMEATSSPNNTFERNVSSPLQQRGSVDVTDPVPGSTATNVWSRQRGSMPAGRMSDFDSRGENLPPRTTDEGNARALNKHRGSMARTAHQELQMAQRVPSLASIFSRPPPLNASRNREGSGSGNSLRHIVAAQNAVERISSTELLPSTTSGASSAGSPRAPANAKLTHMLSKDNDEWMERINSAGSMTGAGPSRHAPSRPVAESLSPRAASPAPDVPHRQRSASEGSPGRGSFQQRAYQPVWNRVLGGVGMWIVRGRAGEGRASPASNSPGVLSKEGSGTGREGPHAMLAARGSVGAVPVLNASGRTTPKPSVAFADDLSQHTLSLKIMIGAGEVCVCHVGGGFDEDANASDDPRGALVPRWEFFIADRPHAPELDANGDRQPIAQIADVDKHAQAGDVILSREFHVLVDRDCEVEVCDAEAAKLMTVLTSPLKQNMTVKKPPTSGKSAKLLPGSKIREPDLSAEPEEFSNLSAEVKSRLASLMRMHILGSVRKHIEAGQLDFVNEIRHLTVLFMGFPGLKQAAAVDEAKQVANLQWYMMQVQATIRKHDGSLLQFRCDEKGFLAIAAFGLPGHTHEDNPSRGVQAALEIVGAIKEVMQHRACVGVTTGDLLCSCVGARKMRSEYTVFGDAINLSARLMCKAKANPTWGDVLVDEATKSSSRRKALFNPLEPITVKGKAAPLQVFSAVADEVAPATRGARHARRPSVDMSAFLETKMVGRDMEVEMVMQQVEDLVQNRHGGATLVSGEPGMGKSKLMAELKRKLEQNCMGSGGEDDEGRETGRPRYSVFFAVGDAANKSHKLHPWRRIFRDLFAQDANSGTPQLGPHKKERRNTADDGGSMDEPAAPQTMLGRRLAKRVASYNTEWRRHIARMLDLPECSIPVGVLRTSTDMESLPEQPDESSMGMGHGRYGSTLFAHPSTHGLAQHGNSHQGIWRHSQDDSDIPEGAGMRIPGLTDGPSSNGTPMGESAFTHVSKLSHAPSGVSKQLMRDSDLPLVAAESVRGNMHAGLGTMADSLHGMTFGHMAQPLDPQRSGLHTVPSVGSLASGVTAQITIPASIPEEVVKDERHLAGGKSRMTLDGGVNPAQTPKAKSSSISFLVMVLVEFVQLYGPIVIMLEDIHHYDTWSWQMLLKVVDELNSSVLLLASLRPKDGSLAENTRFLVGKAAVYQEVSAMYKHVHDLPTTNSIQLLPFNAEQTRSLMQEVGKGAPFSDDWVRAVREKTGGMPMYIEKVAEFLCAKPWMTNEEFGFSGNINGLIGNLSFQQVIMERVDRLRPAVHLTLKVASIMGQWVDLDILHAFYPLDKHKAELKVHLLELEAGNFLKATDTTDVWEFNTVERDIVYEVIPHYQRRRLHAKLAQELESRGGEASLTTIAYHWNQSCMGCEVAEMPSAMKAIEFWEKAADACSKDSWVEALRLYNKAADIADILSEYFYQQPDEAKVKEQFSNKEDGKREIDWSLINSFRRATWELAMAQLCLAIINNTRSDESGIRGSEPRDFDHVTLLTEHAHKGLWLLGAPDSAEVGADRGAPGPGGGWLLSCFHCGRDNLRRANLSSSLDHEEVAMICELLWVLLKGMDYWPRENEDDWVLKMWKYVLRVCTYYRQLVSPDPFGEIVGETLVRLRSRNTSMLDRILGRFLPLRTGGNKVLPMPSDLSGGRPSSVASEQQTFSKDDAGLNRAMSV